MIKITNVLPMQRQKYEPEPEPEPEGLMEETTEVGTS